MSAKVELLESTMSLSSLITLIQSNSREAIVSDATEATFASVIGNQFTAEKSKSNPDPYTII